MPKLKTITGFMNCPILFEEETNEFFSALTGKSKIISIQMFSWPEQDKIYAYIYYEEEA